MNQVSIFFDNYANKFETLYTNSRNPLMRWFDMAFRKDIFIRYEMSFEMLGDITGKSVLDVGCGPGVYMLEALRRGAVNVTGIDPSLRMLEIAHKRIAQCNLLDYATFLPCTFPNGNLRGSYDVAIVMGVLDYVKDPVVFMRELKDCIKVKSVVSFPSVHWLRTPIRKVRYNLRRCPVFFYDRNRIESLVRDVGFSEAVIRKIPGAGLDYVACLAP